ncbi:MAG TPA: hypothetical protein DEG43_12790 [Acidimicrobiaceae bacterium]|nr:hypothetical protein [Acidimicrobiaceae bacterium]
MVVVVESAVRISLGVGIDTEESGAAWFSGSASLQPAATGSTAKATKMAAIERVFLIDFIPARVAAVLTSGGNGTGEWFPAGAPPVVAVAAQSSCHMKQNRLFWYRFPSMRLPAPERRKQLLEKALEVFAQDGYHATSMNDIADAAGVTKPVLYQHFDSKRHLYLELLADIGAELREMIAKTTANAPGPRQQIELGFDAYFRFVAQSHDSFTVLFGDNTRRDAEFAVAARAVEASIAEIVADLIDIPSMSRERRLMLGAGIIGLAEGACHYWIDNALEVDPAQLAREVSRLAWVGLRGVG